MLLKLRHWLVLILFILLPFHAFFVTVGTKMIAGAGHAPIVWLAVWKEVVIGLVFLGGMTELAIGVRSSEFGVRSLKAVLGGRKKILWRGGAETVLITALLLIAFLISGFRIPDTAFVFGFKYLFVPLIFFLLLSRLEWEKDFLERKVFPAILIVGGIVSAYGIVTFFLPMEFFTALGYSDAHSLYAPGSALSAFAQIGESGIRRIQSTFSGPNQLGIWLLLPWSLGICLVALKRVTGFWLLVISLIGVGIVVTFSRSAWIAAFVIKIYAGFVMLRGKKRVALIGALTVIAVIVTVIITFVSPQLILRSISNRHHIERVQEGFLTMIEYPLGLGLGSAGPASNRVSDPCLSFNAGADISWAKNRNDLCLFVGGAQVQPSPDDRVCKCAFLPENWYVQVGVELGVLGFALFLTLIFAVLYKLASVRHLPVLLGFLGVSIASLFLHAWEDSAVAYTVWGVAGIVMWYNRK